MPETTWAATLRVEIFPRRRASKKEKKGFSALGGDVDDTIVSEVFRR